MLVDGGLAAGDRNESSVRAAIADEAEKFRGTSPELSEAEWSTRSTTSVSTRDVSTRQAARCLASTRRSILCRVEDARPARASLRQVGDTGGGTPLGPVGRGDLWQ
jgi:hypothetical protein